jgi:hypothetical protein
VYRDMEQWAEIRQRVLVDGESKRKILRETGMHWTTLEKILSESEPADYRLKQPRPKPVIGPYLDQIQQILKEDREAPRKQRHSAMRIFKRIKDAGYTGGYTQVKEAVNDLRQTSREVFVPLEHKPGEAQVDFGRAHVWEQGELEEVAYFVMSLMKSRRGAVACRGLRKAPFPLPASRTGQAVFLHPALPQGHHCAEHAALLISSLSRFVFGEHPGPTPITSWQPGVS